MLKGAGQASQETSAVTCNLTQALLSPFRINAGIDNANHQAVFKQPDKGWDLEMKLGPVSRTLVFWCVCVVGEGGYVNYRCQVS